MLDLQKATLSNRISAFLFDAILMFIAVIGFGMIFSNVVGYDEAFEKHNDMGYAIYEECGLENPRENVKVFKDLVAKYDEFLTWKELKGAHASYYECTIDAEKSHVNFNEEQKAEFAKIEKMIEPVNVAAKKMADSKEYIDQLERVYALSVYNVAISAFLGFLLLEFLIPLLLGNGQTLGKKIFGIAVIKINGVKISTFQLFVRSLLVKYTLETMVPGLLAFMILYNVFGLGLVGTAIILGLLISQVILYIKTETNSLIHDIVAVTVCVDIHSQMIFNTEDELIAYKEQQAEKSVGKGIYGAESEINVYSSYASNYSDANSTEEKETMGDDAYSSVNMGTLTLSDITIDDVADRDFFKSDAEMETQAEESQIELADAIILGESSEESVCDEASEEIIEETEEAEEIEEASIEENDDDVEETTEDLVDQEAEESTEEEA